MSKKKKKVGLRELYAKDSQAAEKELIGSESRRGFLTKAGVLAMGGLLGAPMVFGHRFPSGLIPAGLLETGEPIPGKSGELIILNDRPINAETPPHLLDPEITPAEVFFVRNNGLVPDNPNPNKWTLTIDGEAVREKKTFTLAELKSQFKHHTYQLTLECGGNGRSEFNPPAKGNQWTVGAVGCAKWTGVRLKDVLQKVGLKENAQYIGYYGADLHLTGNDDKVVISRGVPIKKALEDESLIAWAMNGEDLPLMNGYPLRLVFGGWPASTSGKWLKRIAIRDKVHDGPKMGGSS